MVTIWQRCFSENVRREVDGGDSGMATSSSDESESSSSSGGVAEWECVRWRERSVLSALSSSNSSLSSSTATTTERDTVRCSVANYSSISILVAIVLRL